MCLRTSEKGTVAALESLRGKVEGSGGRRKIERDQIMKEHLDNGTNLRFLESFFYCHVAYVQ